MKPNTPQGSRATYLCVGLIGIVTLLFFWTYFLFDQALYAGDTAFVFVPFRRFLAEHLAQGTIPLWNSFLFGGTPALAESQYQVFYPPNALLVVLGAARGISMGTQVVVSSPGDAKTAGAATVTPPALKKN